MKTIRVRSSSLYDPPRFRRCRLVKRTGRLAVVRDGAFRFAPEHVVIHVPTGLRCHPHVENLTRSQALAAMALLAAVGDWDWTDPLGVVEMPHDQNRFLYDCCRAVGEMVRS